MAELACIEIPSQNFIVYSGVKREESDESHCNCSSSTYSSSCLPDQTSSTSSTSCSQIGEKILECHNRDPIFITKILFGHVTDPQSHELEEVYLYEIKNRNGMSVKLITYGARIHDIIVPDRNYVPKSVVLNVPTLEDYLECSEKYLNATIGRTSDIIKGARFCIDGESCDLSENYKGVHHFNGGSTSFSSKNWLSEVDGSDILMTLISCDGDEGYPGSVMIQARFSLSPENNFKITYTARSTHSTPLDISNRTFYNLSGDKEKGSVSLYDHIIQINADFYTTRDDKTSLVANLLKHVTDTEFDLRTPQTLGVAMKRHPNLGFDNVYKILKGDTADIALVARIIHPITGIAMEFYTNQDFVWLNTCNDFPNPNDSIFPDYDLDFLGLEPFPLKPFLVPTKVESGNGVNEEVTGGSNLNVDKKSNESESKETTSPSQQSQKRKSQPQTSEVLLPKHSEFTLHGSVTNLNPKCEDSKLSQDEDEKAMENAPFLKHAAFYIQPQNFPGAVNNQKLYPSIILRPGHVYTNEMLLKFGLHTGPIEEKEGKRPMDPDEKELVDKSNPCCRPDCPRRFLKTCCLYCEKHCRNSKNNF